MWAWYQNNINTFVYYMLLILATKCIFIGGEFNFIHWIKYGKDYVNWYYNREEYLDYKKQINK